MFLEFQGIKITLQFFWLLYILCKLAQWQLSVVLSKVIFCYNSVKYEANFIIFLLLLEMITALNLLKRFPPHFNCIVRLLR